MAQAQDIQFCTWFVDTLITVTLKVFKDILYSVMMQKIGFNKYKKIYKQPLWKSTLQVLSFHG